MLSFSYSDSDFQRSDAGSRQSKHRHTPPQNRQGTEYHLQKFSEKERPQVCANPIYFPVLYHIP
jgi:hypothetical protein